jgi:hypothetical protein
MNVLNAGLQDFIGRLSFIYDIIMEEILTLLPTPQASE